MTENELKSLSRKQLLELLLLQTQRADRLEAELEEAKRRIRDKKLIESEAGSIAEALVTTATGLCISIPAVICHNHFVATVNRRIAAMESIATAVVIQVCGRNLVGKNL